MTPRQLLPAEYAELLHYGIGLTDLNKVTAGSDSDVGTGGFDVPQLETKLEQYRPGWIAFNGKTAARGALGQPVDYGVQAERLGSTRVFVLPSTSGAARGFWDLRHWRQLAETV